MLAGAVADALTVMHSAMLKCLFVVSGNCIHKGFYCNHREKPREFEILRGRFYLEHLTKDGYIVPEHRHACTAFVFGLPVVHLPVTLKIM